MTLYNTIAKFACSNLDLKMVILTATYIHTCVQGNGTLTTAFLCRNANDLLVKSWWKRTLILLSRVNWNMLHQSYWFFWKKLRKGSACQCMHAWLLKLEYLPRRLKTQLQNNILEPVALLTAKRPCFHTSHQSYRCKHFYANSTSCQNWKFTVRALVECPLTSLPKKELAKQKSTDLFMQLETVLATTTQLYGHAVIHRQKHYKEYNI